MDSNKSKRVVVYCRVATQAQLDGDHTLEAQSARLHEYAGRNEYEIMGEVRAYEKGVTLDRDGWKRACQEAVEQKVDTLFVADLTRIARDPILWMQALRELSGKGVWIQSAAEPDAFRVDPLFHLWLPPGIQWQLALHELWKTYRRNNESEAMKEQHLLAEGNDPAVTEYRFTALPPQAARQTARRMLGEDFTPRLLPLEKLTAFSTE